MIKKTVNKRVKAKEVIGSSYSQKELEYNKKHNIYMPEEHDMIVTNKPAKSVAEFERHLKTLNPRLYIHFNKNVPKPSEPFGHIIRYKDDTLPNKYDPICGVGCGGVIMLPSQSIYKKYFNEEKKLYETRLEFKGWVAAEEQVITFLVSRGK